MYIDHDDDEVHVDHVLDTLLGLGLLTHPKTPQSYLRIDPACHSVAEEYKVWNHTTGVDRYQLTHASEGGVLLIIVSDVAERGAPGSDKLKQRWRHDLWTHQPHPDIIIFSVDVVIISIIFTFQW